MSSRTNVADPPAALARGRRESGLRRVLARPLRRGLLRLLRDPRCGTIVVELPDGERLEGRGAAAGPHASIVLHRWRALARLAWRGDFGLAESYRDGDWSTPDLVALLEFGARNAGGGADPMAASAPTRWLSRLAHRRRANSRRGSRRNIAFHYDLGNAFYAHWLDAGMTYSSALYAQPGQTLEQAQQAKLDRILALLRLDELPAASSVLEIGCGWGALACAIARAHPAAVTALTLSERQLAHARDRVAAEGLRAQVDLRLQDYRDVEGTYERIVSIEMLEAVGERYWPAYFRTLGERLRPGGRAVLQVITIADDRFEHYRREPDFIQRAIFPGGMLPSPGALRAEIERAGLALVGSETFGASYAATLVEWRRRFLHAWPELQALGFDARFRRLWEYYLCYCEAGFRAGQVDVGLYVVAHAAERVSAEGR